MSLISLEKHFKEVCEQHPHLKLLESQWRFDQELISKALQNVSAIFPHYSRHDASHSRQILVNIERMLGDKVQYLTASDTWLIMEAAYNHDIGMVITHKQIKDMDTPEFAGFVKDIIAEPEHELYKFAKKWQKEKATLPQGKDAHIFFNQYIQLLAEWYRKKHPINSAKIVNNPYDEIGLDSPRNKLLPKRLFGVLADICRAHGADFKDVMKLPFSEAGMATEDCHPRYVACLLRMGDLLDLDDNRFCPVMMNMCGSHLPHLSKAHLDKHHSIKHFRLDAERIEVTSECPNPAAYEVSFEWFKWLEGEYHQQTQHWNKIVPSKELGNLPTLKKPIVDIKPPYLILEQGKKPSFKVDQEAVLELVRGTGLYSSKFDSIREILQNAVDATLIAIWLKHKDEIENLSPTKQRFREILDQYPIDVDFAVDPKDEEYWILRVTDQGTGISFETLKYMLDVGSSSKNKKKRNIINVMPMWYRPSGTFGIGLQSAYLIANKFSIQTKSLETHEALHIKFSQKSEKPVIIKKIDSSSMDYGSIFEIKIKITDFPETIRRPFFEESEISRRLDTYDFTVSGANLRCYETLMIDNAVISFNEKSPIKIRFSESFLNYESENYFCEKNNIIISDMNFIKSDRGRQNFFFRGQRFGDFNPYLKCLSVNIDFYGFSAKEFLTYNREKILRASSKIAYKVIIDSILSYLDKKFEQLPKDQMPYAAAFYFLYSSKETPLSILSALNDFDVSFYFNNSKTIKELMDDIKAKKINNIYTTNENQPKQKDWLLHSQGSDTVLMILKYQLTKEGWFYQKNAGLNEKYTGFFWSESDIQPISNNNLKELLNKERIPASGVGSRFLFPCWDKYRKLALKTKVKWARIYQYESYYSDFMVLPCFFNEEHGKPIEFDESDDLAQWTFKNRKNDAVTLEEIKALYQELRQHLKNIMNAPDEVVGIGDSSADVNNPPLVE